MSLCLGEFLDEAQLEVSDDEEDESHDSQSQMILPQTPGWVIDALFIQKVLTCGAAVMRKWSKVVMYRYISKNLNIMKKVNIFCHSF